MKRARKDRHRLSHENRLTWLTLFAAAPAILIALALLWFGDYTAKVQWTLTLLIAGCAAGFVSSVREHVVRPLQTMTNLLAALREGDYSIRARGARENDALGEALLEINSLGETLRVQRLGAFEATALLRTIMAEIDVAVFTFDPERRLRLVNRAGENLLGQPIDKLLGRRASDLGLAACFESDEDAPLNLSFPGGSGRWGVRRSTFRERGLPHELLVLTDLSRTLREEERIAWQRLVRVLGHEMNNSLAPIKSIAGSLESLLRRQPPPSDWQDDARSGLKSIATRADSLSRFMQAYARLAKLPPPQKEELNLGELIRRVASLETRMTIEVRPGRELSILADGAQIEQLLINILHNAVDASLDTRGGVVVGWREEGDCVEVFAQDEGPGIMNPTNLFVPFFTTKPTGSGIGLALSRQIAEAHGGSLTLANRKGKSGAEALLRLPQ
ncbi:MAG: two-component system, NtrC family, nitrogen regulation sensor histidine kinase NtrY [Verrucomicrobiota bacterium]|jgi:nitrogen fixation/metabolism regulation signal transduction histidine kinase